MFPNYESYREALDKELRDVFSSRQGFLYDVLRYHLGWTDEQGNPQESLAPLHFPSVLALASCHALSGDFRSALPAAAGVELVYNFTLVHGDVQSGRPDGGDRPSIWWLWGPAQAINAGDGLHALGRTTTMRLAQRGIPHRQVLQAVQSLDRACLVLCEGQYMDLEFQDRLLVTADDYFDMVRRKTGSLTGCSAESGALAAGADEDGCSRFREIGANLGMAWQISRDIQDLWGRQGDGMTAGNVLQKKKSLPLIHALATAPLAAKRELGNIYMKRVLEPDDAARLVQLLDQTDSREFATGKAGDLVDQALHRMDEVNLDVQGEEILRNLGQSALEGAL